MTTKAFSIAKFGEQMNEDAVLARPGILAVSDGAGGGGLFADEWATHLVTMLPDTPVTSFAQLDGWVDSIWEPFYNAFEQRARQLGGMHLAKFYREGSFATLAAIWCGAADGCHWMAYGDSVAFCYSRRTGLLQHSFTRLAHFNHAPWLISCKDPLNAEGFRAGVFDTDESSILFVASDALAHYIIMMYELCHRADYADELQEAVDARTKASNYVAVGLALPPFDFESTVVDKLLRLRHNANFATHLLSRYRKGLLALDDYSIAMSWNNDV